VIAAGELHERSPSRLRRPPVGLSLCPARDSPHPRKRAGGASNLIGDAPTLALQALDRRRRGRRRLRGCQDHGRPHHDALVISLAPTTDGARAEPVRSVEEGSGSVPPPPDSLAPAEVFMPSYRALPCARSARALQNLSLQARLSRAMNRFGPPPLGGILSIEHAFPVA
jgi:hypothetical protein